MILNRVRAAGLLAAVGTTVVISMLGTGSAQAAPKPVSDNPAVHSVDGCNVTENLQYDPKTNSSTVHISFHNGQLFAACRVSLRGRLTLSLKASSGTIVDFLLPVHQTIGCAFFDPNCSANVDQTWTDYDVVPPSLTHGWKPVVLRTLDAPGYTSTPNNLAPEPTPAR